ncbi:MAG TPA: 4'-phosphopantetheinyl transferase superfamily protein [Bryobacteraceae bacterium]|nr:4'-phosphopantetheinyl transferase superfamily protein [Bryobacteraceae bacterium]
MWSVLLTATEATTDRLFATLSPDERDRAARFHFNLHRHRFVLSRGLLRVLLARYLDTDPAALVFGYGPQGKPELPGSGLCFNVSHSGNLAAHALVPDPTGSLELGIDVESIRTVSHSDAVARRFFCPAEWQEIETLPPAERADAFFRCWTRKEAYVKALGGGLSVPLDRFQVSLLPGHPARLISLDGDPVRASEWSLYHLDPAEGYTGALAVHATGFRLRACHACHVEASLDQLSL